MIAPTNNMTASAANTARMTAAGFGKRARWSSLTIGVRKKLRTTAKVIGMRTSRAK